MNTYRVYRLGPDSRIIRGEWFEAASEDDARSRALEFCDDLCPRVELWQGATCLGQIECASR